MGITLLFMKVEDGDKVDADKAAVTSLLEQRGLRVLPGPDGGQIVTHDGQPLSFDGSPSDMFLGHLDDPDPLIGAISHATLTAQECEFVYDLCVAAGFLIVHVPGSPLYVVPERNHAPEDVPDAGDAAWVASSTELAHVLSGEDQSAEPAL